jgi:hypothetical protein
MAAEVTKVHFNSCVFGCLAKDMIENIVNDFPPSCQQYKQIMVDVRLIYIFLYDS